ncbi:MAG: hypothetical protein GY821_11230 [Gammaproteobacteria bacterium]|nr:hypothetical protein [Gammaproteobacteria bacterium]
MLCPRSGLILTNTIIPLDLLVTISDDDGSEVFTTPTSMTIDFNYLPDGATLDGGGTLIGNTWTGTNSELDGLSLNLAPGTTTEFDGEISVDLTAESNEGMDTSFYTIEVVGVDDAGADKLVGDANNNLIQGGGGDDEIEGGGGNDTIDGGTGTNSLEGNAGEDTFIVFDQDLEHGAMNTITNGDFDETEDILDFTDVLSFDILADDADLFIEFDSSSGDTKVTIDKNGSNDFDVNSNPNAFTTFVLEGVALNQSDVQTLVDTGHILVDT